MRAGQRSARGTTGIWAAVEHRSRLLREMMAAAAEFVKCTQREAAPAKQGETLPEPQVPFATAVVAACPGVAPDAAPTMYSAAKTPVTIPTAAFMASYGSTRLADLPPVGDPTGPAPALDPRFRLAQLLSGRAVALQVATGPV